MAEQTEFKRKPNGIAEDLGHIIGLSNTLLLCGIRGGDNLYVPNQPTPGHWLEKLIGKAAFAAMVEEWGGTSFTVPGLADYGRYQRIRKCAEMVAAGRSMQSIAALTGVTVNQAKNDRRSAELLGLLPMVFCGQVAVKSDAEIIEQMRLPGL